MCARRFACVNCRAHVRGTRVYMNLHNKKHGTYVDSAYTFFQFCPYPEDGLPIHCCSVSYSCDVSLRKLKLENCLCTGSFAVRTGPTESLIKTDIQIVIQIIQEKHPALHLLQFYVFPIGICLVPTG